MTTEVVIKNVRFGFLKVFKDSGKWTSPEQMGGGKFPKVGYSLVGIVRKGSAAAAALAAAANEEKIGTWRTLKDAAKEMLSDPIQDGDVKRAGEADYAGCLYFNVSGDLADPVFVVGPNNQPASKEHWNAGDSGALVIRIYGNKERGRLSFYLIGLQFLKKGEPMIRVSTPDKYFQVEAIEPAEDF